jgi:DNA primase
MHGSGEMIKQSRLSDLIREKIFLKPTSTGWEVCKCPLCNDYKVRGGFKVTDESVIYSCFNCGVSTVYEEFSGRISKSFRRVLNAFGIDDGDIGLVVNSAFFVKKEEKKVTLASLTKINTSTPTIKLPPNSFKLGETTDHLDIQEKIVAYLDSRRVDLDSYSFFFSTNERFKDRVIVPFYRNGNLIYWQARSINKHEKKRWDNAVVPKDAVMFNIDQLHSFSPIPLFVSEGVFDAMMFDGLAVLGSKNLTEAKIELLANTRRRLVFVIDKDDNGRKFAESVLKAGWEITFAPEGADDLNKSVQRFGKAWTAQQIIKNIPKNLDQAMLALKLNCK